MHLSSVAINVKSHEEMMALIKTECVKTESMCGFVHAQMTQATHSISTLWLDSHTTSIKSQQEPKWKRSTVTRLAEVESADR